MGPRSNRGQAGGDRVEEQKMKILEILRLRSGQALDRGRVRGVLSSLFLISSIFNGSAMCA